MFVTLFLSDPIGFSSFAMSFAQFLIFVLVASWNALPSRHDNIFPNLNLEIDTTAKKAHRVSRSERNCKGSVRCRQPKPWTYVTSPQLRSCLEYLIKY
ncbi:hypothetical protein BC938DRAFT_481295 [Jimgerdemannia flammicorona]|uniref:Uncharacterized protein n=1 Tax=Jimgerdemannia flammicorona TaxID=994334 RepID=A0A433QGE5_9FUNG|nr:hypothetical protein BC938DRAFT_481295 [Jimgerdemannia flammicorona]